MPDEGDPKRYYYYAVERGCMKDPDSLDELGVGVNDGAGSCSLKIALFRLRDRFTMKLSVHNDEWRVFVACRDVLDLLSKKVIGPGEMKGDGPFHALRSDVEKLGYRNLGRLRE